MYIQLVFQNLKFLLSVFYTRKTMYNLFHLINLPGFHLENFRKHTPFI